MEMDIQQIWEQFRKTHSDKFRNILMEHYAADFIPNTRLLSQVY